MTSGSAHATVKFDRRVHRAAVSAAIALGLAFAGAPALAQTVLAPNANWPTPGNPLISPVLGLPSSASFSDSFAGGVTFDDHFDFTLSNFSSFESLVESISTANILGISNLGVRLYYGPDVASNVAPSTGGGTIAQAWIYQQNLPVGATALNFAYIPPTVVPGSNFVLEVTGTTLAGGGSFSGTMNLSAVPEPTAVTLLAAGLAVLATALRFYRR